ncbi:MAG: hypothetical protein ACLT98_04340 [Eggerthellaceae bacterium]
MSFGASALLLAVLAASTRRVRGCRSRVFAGCSFFCSLGSLLIYAGTHANPALLWSAAYWWVRTRASEPCWRGSPRARNHERARASCGGAPLNIVAILLVACATLRWCSPFCCRCSQRCAAVYLVRGQNQRRFKP